MLTPKRVIHPSSSNSAEILVACEDENGNPVNITLVNKRLGAVLAETPAMISNPDHQPLIDEVLVEAAKQIKAAAALAATAAAAAEAELNG